MSDSTDKAATISKANTGEVAASNDNADSPTPDLQTGAPVLLPRALADVVNQRLSQHGADEEPVTAVSVVQLETRDIEMIEREFGGTRVHAKEVPFDLFAAPSSNPSPISGTAQSGGEAPPAVIVKPE